MVSDTVLDGTRSSPVEMSRRVLIERQSSVEPLDYHSEALIDRIVVTMGTAQASTRNL
jgi:hypothetical protein